MVRYGDDLRSNKQKGRFFRKIQSFLECSKGSSKTSIQSHGNSRGKDINNSHGSSWVQDRLLGKGNYGTVFLAKSRAPDFPSEIAVKSSFIADSYSLQSEKNVLGDLALCMNIVHCYGDEITETESGEKVYNILLEYCPGCSLYEHIKSRPFGLPELEIRRYTRDIVRGIAFTHSSGYIHCDIKPDNVLLLPDIRDREKKEKCILMAKIADFGMARKRSETMTDVREVMGLFRTRYMSPELMRDKKLDWRADIWAMGCVVVEMLTGQAVWSYGRDGYDFINLITCSEELPKIPSYSSKMAKDFLGKCLVRDPYKRSNAWGLLDHPFLQL